MPLISEHIRAQEYPCWIKPGSDDSGSGSPVAEVVLTSVLLLLLLLL
jgi:hypothetical protein